VLPLDEEEVLDDEADEVDDEDDESDEEEVDDEEDDESDPLLAPFVDARLSVR
jgi:hypothetical protein